MAKMRDERSGNATVGWVSLAGLTMALAATGCATQQPPMTAKPLPDFASACESTVLQAAASKASTTVTVKEVENGPKLPGGAKYFPATAKLPAYCQVSGSFVTNPESGKTANFLATFPAAWNGKYLQYGCFGHCGFFSLNDSSSNLVTIVAQGYPGEALTKGYASFGTDQGHMGAGGGNWAIKGPGQIDDDKLTDFLYRANQVLARAGKEFTTAFYAAAKGQRQPIARSYFAGCSGGGRDALVAASRFPEEFDGIISGSPYANMMSVAFQSAGGALAAIRSADADILPDLMARVDPYVKAQCDKLDGVEDGLIQNPAICNFRPERDLPRCDGNSPAGQCFTPAQIETISTQITAVTDEHGNVVQPAFSASELQFVAHMPTRPQDPSALEPWPEGDDYAKSGNSLWPIANASLKIFAHRNDPNFHTRSIIDFKSGGPGKITDFRMVVPQSEVKLAMAAGGPGLGDIPENVGKLIKQKRKLLIWQNLSDEKLTPYMSINYYKRLAGMYGGYPKLQDNVRLFNIPGSSHCSITGVGPNNFDALEAMENWVEKGKAPDSLVASLYNPSAPIVDRSKKPLRTMPLCKFPEMARYSGQGDVKDAANWSCPSGDTSMLKVGESGRRAGVIE